MLQLHTREGRSETDLWAVPPHPSFDTSEQARSVLYIDDDWAHLLYQRMLLESAGYTVEATDSPTAALRSYVRSSFDVVIIDFHLPFASSGLLASVMRLFRRDTPLIVIADANEPVEGEPGLWDRQFPQDLPPALFLENVGDVIERTHDRSPDHAAGARKPLVFGREI